MGRGVRVIPTLPELIAVSDRVPGWFEPVDVAMFWACAHAQSACDVGGDILEIGTYMGRSAVVLGYFTRTGEALTVCDVFEDVGSDVSAREEWTRTYSSLTRAGFEQNYLRQHGRLPTIRQVPSSELMDAEAPRSFRLIHVDGSHLFKQVSRDVEIVRELACDRAIVMFDDIARPSAPGVAAAVWPAVVGGSLIPVLLTRNKLYAIPRADPSLVRAIQDRVHALRGVSLHQQAIGPCDLLVVEHDPDVDICSGKLRRVQRLARRVGPPIVVDTFRRVGRGSHKL